jgi:phosphoribosylaminoimidazolecarboxamide formyltransferase/IMP cyclohydrolase
MDGRLKTLHPKIFGGLLCRHDHDDDLQALRDHGIASFELVVVNLYPFEATVARPEVTEGEAIEQIDIGGPSLLRAAAKNHAFVTVATDPNQYGEILEQIRQTGRTTLDLRRRLAADVFARTATYDRAISDFFDQRQTDSSAEFPARIHLSCERVAALRYGENPHQQAAVYRCPGGQAPSLIDARQLCGKELSYNNLLDLDAALTMARSLPAAAASPPAMTRMRWTCSPHAPNGEAMCA